MRQTLLRLWLTDPFAWFTRPNDPGFDGWGPGLYVGVGWLIVPFALWLAWWFRGHLRAVREARETNSESPRFVSTFPWESLIVPVGAVLVVPWLAGSPGKDGVLPQSIPVFGYGLMLCLAFLAGIGSAMRRARLIGLPPELVSTLGLILLVSGIAGCRLFYILQYGDRVYAGADSLGDYLVATISLQKGGLVLYGGLVLGVVCFLGYCRLKKLPPLLVADMAVPSAFLGISLGRIGCLFNGCCYGDLCERSWAIPFPKDSMPWTAYTFRGWLPPDAGTIWLQPSQVISSATALLLFFVTNSYFRTRPRAGSVLGVSLIGYALGRFLVEFLRGDELGKFGTGLTISQWVSLGTFAVGVALLLVLLGRSGPTPRDRQPAVDPAAAA